LNQPFKLDGFSCNTITRIANQTFTREYLDARLRTGLDPEAAGNIELTTRDVIRFV
jgi:hypothetical protein